MPHELAAALIQENSRLLREILPLLEGMDDCIYSTVPLGFAPHKVGGHLRHVLEFYECFLRGLESGLIDYDSRQRQESVERSRHCATLRVRALIGQLDNGALLREDRAVVVRMENSDGIRLTSSIGRELQALASHTIHHFALIALTLRLHGFEVDPEFGMSPSTLRYQAERGQASFAGSAK